MKFLLKIQDETLQLFDTVCTGFCIDIVGVVFDGPHGNEVLFHDFLVAVIHDQKFNDFLFPLRNVVSFHETFRHRDIDGLGKLMERFDKKVPGGIDHAEQADQHVEKGQKRETEGQYFPFHFQLVGVHVHQNEKGNEYHDQQEHVPDDAAYDGIGDFFPVQDEQDDHVKAYQEQYWTIDIIHDKLTDSDPVCYGSNQTVGNEHQDHRHGGQHDQQDIQPLFHLDIQQGMDEKRQRVNNAPQAEVEQVDRQHAQIGVMRIGKEIPVNAEGIQGDEKSQ